MDRWWFLNFSNLQSHILSSRCLQTSHELLCRPQFFKLKSLKTNCKNPNVDRILSSEHLFRWNCGVFNSMINFLSSSSAAFGFWDLFLLLAFVFMFIFSFLLLLLLLLLLVTVTLLLTPVPVIMMSTIRENMKLRLMLMVRVPNARNAKTPELLLLQISII